MKLILGTLLLSTSLSTAWAGSEMLSQQRSTYVRQNVNPKPAESLNVDLNRILSEKNFTGEQVLKDMAEKMTATLNEIQELIHKGHNGKALGLAKNTLDEVRVKTGIDPKAKLQMSFLVPTIFPQDATNMHSLNLEEQNFVITTIRDFRGGLYLDIVNLSKRTTLLYIRALHNQVKKDGGLTSEDRNKIVKDLAKATIVPMYVMDKKGRQIVVFDEDVMNEDHTYMFNREIKIYLLNAKDLAISEKDFDTYKTEIKSSLSGGNSAGNSKKVFNYSDPEFLACYNIYDISLSSADASNICMNFINKGIRIFKETNFLACYNIYDVTLSSADASNQCIEKLKE